MYASGLVEDVFVKEGAPALNSLIVYEPVCREPCSMSPGIVLDMGTRGDYK